VKYGLPENVKPVEMTFAESVKNIYALQSMGIPAFKRSAYRLLCYYLRKHKKFFIFSMRAVLIAVLPALPSSIMRR